jgi:Phage protein Gp138 N-terminal domain
MPANDTPSLGDVILTALDTRLRNTAVALPGTVESYNASDGTCTVKPGVNRMVPSFDDEDLDVSEELPSLQDVPVCWLVGRGIQVKGSLQPGDTVLLLAMDRDMSGWQRTGKHSDPEDGRMHSWSSCVAIPGLVPASSPFPEPTDAAALSSKLDALIAAILSATPAAPAGSDAGEPGLLALQAKLLAAPPVGMGAGAPGFTTGSTVLKLQS